MILEDSSPDIFPTWLVSALSSLRDQRMLILHIKEENMASQTVHKRTEVSWGKDGGCCYSWIYAYALRLYECNFFINILCLPLYILCACHCTYIRKYYGFGWMEGGPLSLLFFFFPLFGLGQGVCFLEIGRAHV